MQIYRKELQKCVHITQIFYKQSFFFFFMTLPHRSGYLYYLCVEIIMLLAKNLSNSFKKMRTFVVILCKCVMFCANYYSGVDNYSVF